MVHRHNIQAKHSHIIIKFFKKANKTTAKPQRTQSKSTEFRAVVNNPLRKDLDSSAVAFCFNVPHSHWVNRAKLGTFSSLLQPLVACLGVLMGQHVGEVDSCPVVSHVAFFRRLARQSCSCWPATLSSNPLWKRASLWLSPISDVGQLHSKSSHWS